MVGSMFVRSKKFSNRIVGLFVESLREGGKVRQKELRHTDSIHNEEEQEKVGDNALRRMVENP